MIGCFITMELFYSSLLFLSMVLINDFTPRGQPMRFTPLRIGGMLSPDPRGDFGRSGDWMAYEDVIPVELFTPGAAAAVMGLLLSLPLPGADRVRIFISWAKDVEYKYTGGDLESLK